MSLLAATGAVAAVAVPAFGYAVYSGLFTSINISTGPPPVKNLVILYKFYKGAYSNAGKGFKEVTKLASTQRCVGIYYDNPNQVCTLQVNGKE